MFGHDRTAEILDAIKELGFHYASKAGITIAINDIEVAQEKPAILEEAESKVNQFQQQFLDGLITEDERYRASVDAWTEAQRQPHPEGSRLTCATTAAFTSWPRQARRATSPRSSRWPECAG